MTNTLPALAAAIAEWFPEFNGRALAVSEIDEITKQNLPTLPLAVVALIRETSKHAYQSNGRIEMIEEFIIEMNFDPNKYQLEDGSESPFWSYYNYDYWRDKLLYHIVTERWETPRNGLIEYVEMTQETDPFSVSLVFKFKHHYRYCPPEEEPECGAIETPLRLTSKISAFMPSQCEESEHCEKEADPC